jgi:hypothetical protein
VVSPVGGACRKACLPPVPTRPTLYGVLVLRPGLRQQLGSTVPTGTTHASNPSAESYVDDLGNCRGVVLSRAATILRSIETQP